MAQERVGEYEGASSLGEAGQAVLMNPRLDLAIVKRAGHNLLGIHRRRFTSDEARADFVYENVPELRDLDAAVDAWYNRDLPSANHRQGAHIAQNHLRTDPIERHFDGETNAGPLTLSVRVDSEYGVKRYFHARRASRPATPNQLSRNSMAGYFRQKALGTNLLPPCLNPLYYSEVEQEPGDVVIMPNYTHPAEHYTTETLTTFGTAALILDYMVDFERMIEVNKIRTKQ